MNRLFGSKSSAPKPTLASAISNVEAHIETLDVKLAKINAELSTYQSKIAKMRDGPGKTALRQKAMKLLQRRKQLEAQKGQLEQQSLNMESADLMTTSLKNTMTTVDAMKTTNKTLKQQYGKIDIDKIERIQDEMAELMEVGNEIQESLGRSYDLPEEVDEDELDAELEALGEEVEWEAQQGIGAGEEPAFMRDEVPAFIDEPPTTSGEQKSKEAAT